MREEDFLRVQQTSFAQGGSPLTPEQADAMEADAWAVAQDAAHRALRASQKVSPNPTPPLTLTLTLT